MGSTQTLEAYWGETFHQYAAGLTAAQINNSAFAWGGGTGVVYSSFAVAVVDAGTVPDPSWWDSELCTPFPGRGYLFNIIFFIEFHDMKRLSRLDAKETGNLIALAEVI